MFPVFTGSPMEVRLLTCDLRKFYIRKNNNKADTIETGRIVIAHVRPWSDLEKCMYTTLF